MPIAFSIDHNQGLREADENQLVKLAAELGYESAWTPSGPDAAAFDRCIRWHRVSGLPVGISAVPASGQSPAFYAEQARRVSDATGGRFTLVVGSGRLEHAAQRMREYLPDIRERLPNNLPLYLAALGPLMLRVAAELADGVALNWCTAEHVAWSRAALEEAAGAVGRPVPRVIEYIRTAVDPDPGLAAQILADAAQGYAQMPMYRAHFERMGTVVVGAAGAPGGTRAEFEQLTAGLDLPIVRVLVVRPGDAESARRVLEECRP